MKKTRPKSYKIQKGRSRMNLQPNKFVETYVKKNDGGKEKKKKDKDVFPAPPT